ncbi:MAG: hypothetical protein BWK76_19400 [Desulfobulbaceae bacterium A2]|nr:MAG: hypothetical protein BWK76_19400 [Desulfobulbaceae bacterium A2]
MDLRVTQPCPQCGGAIELSEADRVLACPFCGVRNLLAGGSTPRYLLPDKLPAAQRLDVLLAPYLRFKGSIFAVTNQEIHHAVIDTTQSGCQLPGLPPSLGLRPQAMTLRRLPPKMTGRFLPLSLDIQHILEKAIQLSSPGGNRVAELFNATREQHGTPPSPTPPETPRNHVLHRAMIGEMISVLYLPLLHRRGLLLDGILQTPLADLALDDSALPPAAPAKDSWQPRFLPMLCPNCGGNLDGANDCVVLGCPNCDSAWELNGAELTRVELQGIAGDSDSHLPFWRIYVDIAGLEIDSFADFIVRTNQPVLPRPPWRERPFCFWIPACKLRPQTFLLACRQATLNQYRLDPQPGPLPPRRHPVTLPASEASQALKITLAATAVSRRNIWPRLPEIRFSKARTTLVFLPCRDDGHELLQPQTGLAIAKSILRWGRTL